MHCGTRFEALPLMLLVWSSNPNFPLQQSKLTKGYQTPNARKCLLPDWSLRNAFLLMPEFTAEFPVEVYWEDTDAGGIVYHSNYLKFMERARSNLLKELKVAQANSLDGVLFVAVSVAIRYRRAAKLEDHLTVRTRIKTLRRASIVFEQNVYRGSELITEGEVRVGAVSRRTMAPAAMPESLYEKIRALLDLAD